jgi:hypothetical protein
MEENVLEAATKYAGVSGPPQFQSFSKVSKVPPICRVDPHAGTEQPSISR